MTAKTKNGRNSSDSVSEGVARGLEQFQNGDYLTRDEARASRERGLYNVDVPRKGAGYMNLGIETETREFKKSTSELKEGCASIASILNKHQEGVLYFGVRKDGEVVGQDVSESTMREISQAIGNRIAPKIYPVIEPLEDDRGRGYIRVSFSGDDAPYTCDGRYRIRVADEDVMLSPEEVRRMAAAAELREHPWDELPSNRDFDDVDEETLRGYVKRGVDSGRIAISYTGMRDVLERLGLLVGGRLSNAASVLFCPSRDVELKMGVLESHTRTEILDLQQECGTVFDLVRKAEFYILNNTRRRFLITGNGPREEIPELPRDAVHEALMNAFVHRDWTSAACVQVDIFFDSVEVFSPGWFIEGQDPDAHLSGNSTSSATRNKLIASTLYRSKDIESYGTGIPRIKQLCDAVGIDVEYVKVADGTKLVFHRNDAFTGRRLDQMDVIHSGGDTIYDSTKRADGSEYTRNVQQKRAVEPENVQEGFGKRAVTQKNVQFEKKVGEPSFRQAPSMEAVIAGAGFPPVTRRNVLMVYTRFGASPEFTWQDVSTATGLAERAAHKLVQRMKAAGVIEAAGGRGRYRFVPLIGD